MNTGILIMLLCINSFAHILQAYQSLKHFTQEITPLLVFGVVNALLALGILFGFPYMLPISLVILLIGGIGGGNQIMKLDHGGCINRALVCLNLLLIVSVIILLLR